MPINSLPENTPPPPDAPAPKDKAPTPEQRFDKASGIGRGLLHLTREREAQGFSTFIPRTERFSQGQLAALTKPEVITDEAITQAKRGSFGLTLEAARQIATGDVQRNTRGVHEDLDNLGGFGRVLLDGGKLAKELAVEDPAGYEEAAKEALAHELGKPPAELEMTGEPLQAWVDDTYKKADGFIAGKYAAVKNYLDLRF